MRFVPIKTVEQQSVLMIHRTRQLFVRQRTSLINAIRAHLAEFGIVSGVGRNGVDVLLTLIAEGKDERVPSEARDCLTALAAQLDLIKRHIDDTGYPPTRADIAQELGFKSPNAAEEHLKAAGKPYNKGDIDAQAAAIILQDYLDTL